MEKEFPNKRLEAKNGREVSRNRLLEIETLSKIFHDKINKLYQLRYEANVFVYGSDFYKEQFQKLVAKIDKQILKIM